MEAARYSPCGLYCAACGATDCNGCLSEDAPDDIVTCRFRQCVQKKGFEFCYSCNDYPCEELHAFMNDQWPHHWTMAPNLEYIKKNGVEKWLKSQAEEWSCKQCGGEIMWYQQTCQCGHQLDAWDVPE